MSKWVAGGLFLLLLVGGFVAGRYSGRETDGAVASKRHVLYYVDPMHPSYHSDHPGTAPDCGMPLEPVYDREDDAGKLPLPETAIPISPDKQQLLGVQVETVHKTSGTGLLRTTGRVEADDNRVYRLMPGTEGWVQSLQNNPPGTLVKKNELLAAFYSREFRNAEQAYIGALASVERVRTSRTAEDKANDSSIRTTEEQLRALGMGDPQIQELAKTRQITRDISVVSPVDGVVLARNIAPQQRFEAHTELYRIADLTNVWIIADILSSEFNGLRPGARARVTVRELGKSFYAKVSDSPPYFDAASRSLKVRLDAENPGLLLRPDMFVDLEFNVPAPAGMSVPQTAVLDSGRQKVIYIETSDGIFEQRPVQVGPSFGDRVTVVSGLKQGDRVVTAGNFLIDSESRMRSVTLTSSSGMQDAKQSHPDHNTLATREPVASASRDNTRRSALPRDTGRDHD